jgi:hypothetical protein
MSYGDIVPLHSKGHMLAWEASPVFSKLRLVASILNCRREWQHRMTTARLNHVVT